MTLHAHPHVGLFSSFTCVIVCLECRIVLQVPSPRWRRFLVVWPALPNQTMPIGQAETANAGGEDGVAVAQAPAQLCATRKRSLPLAAAVLACVVGVAGLGAVLQRPIARALWTAPDVVSQSPASSGKSMASEDPSAQRHKLCRNQIISHISSTIAIKSPRVWTASLRALNTRAVLPFASSRRGGDALPGREHGGHFVRVSRGPAAWR
jgi:hypothetical protein